MNNININYLKIGQVDNNLTAAIQSNSTNLPPIPADSMNSALDSAASGALVPSSATQNTLGQNSTTNSGTLGLNSSTGMNSYGSMGGLGSGYGSSYGGMGSSYGGMGGYGSSYGGYGSSYGGYGSSMYGGGYGSSMYGGGYGGYNRFGMMGNGDPNNQNFMQNSMMFLNSFGFVVQAMGEIARTLEMNAQGLVHLFQSLFNLGFRIKGWGVDFFQFMKRMFKKVYDKVFEYVKEKSKVLFIGDPNTNVKIRMRIVQTALRVVLVMFIVSMIPLLKNLLKTDTNEAIFANIQSQM